MQRAEPPPAPPVRRAAPGSRAVPVPLAVAARAAATLAGLAAAAGALAVAEGPGRSTTYAGSSAAGDTQGVLGELRDLAHGIYPAVLAEAGIGPALATLADTAPLPVEILRAGHRRHPEPVELAAYFAVAEALGDAARRGADHAAVSVANEGGRLVVTVEDNGPGDASPIVAAADRVGALGGSLATGPARCRAEIPCASS
jgi:signal transduction histidine kinase